MLLNKNLTISILFCMFKVKKKKKLLRKKKKILTSL